MNIEEILSRLERIDHKEYRCGFEFADSSTFDEMSRCFEERKILTKEIERLNKENEKLKKGLNKLLQLNKYMIHFSSKKVISKLIVKQWDLIYELLEGRPRGIMHGSKGSDKE